LQPTEDAITVLLAKAPEKIQIGFRVNKDGCGLGLKQTKDLYI